MKFKPFKTDYLLFSSFHSLQRAIFSGNDLNECFYRGQIIGLSYSCKSASKYVDYFFNMLQDDKICFMKFDFAKFCHFKF